MRRVLAPIIVNNGAQSGAITVTTYYPIPYDTLVKGVHVVGINPASTDGDTVRVIVDYTDTDGSAASYTTIADTTADEYNDTDDTAALGSISAPNQRSVAATDWGDLTFPGTRVPGDTVIRVREIWAGTVGDGHIVTRISLETLNDTDDS